jgi:hypothetical protein
LRKDAVRNLSVTFGEMRRTWKEGIAFFFSQKLYSPFPGRTEANQEKCLKTAGFEANTDI